MIKKIMLIAFLSVGYTEYAQGMENSNSINPSGINFNGSIPIDFKVGGGESNVPVEFTVSPGTLFAIAGLLGLYQTTSLLKEGIQKYSDPNSEKHAEGRRILMYSGLLMLGSSLAILSKLLPILNK